MWRNRKASSSGKLVRSGRIMSRRISAVGSGRRSAASAAGASARIASRWKTRPSTETRASSARSSSGSRSRRAPSSAWIVGGTGSSPEVAERPAPVLAAEQAVVDQHREQLLGEQRVALGRARRCEPTRPRGSAPRPSRFRPARGSRPRQRLEQDRRGVQLAPAPAGAHVEQLRPRHAQQHDRGLARDVGHVLDQVEEGRLGPLEVVQDHDERAVAARAPRRAGAPPRRSSRVG